MPKPPGRAATFAPSLLLLALPLLPATAAAQDSATSGRALDLEHATRVLTFTVLDLAFRVEDLSGGVKNLRVQENDAEIRIELAADVLFDFDKADLRSGAREALGRVAAIIREHPKGKVRIEGHTDAKGSDSYNQRLSERRAQAVRDWLAGNEGLRKTGFVVKGLGESRPVAPNARPDGSDDPEGRQRNRRVEVVVSKR